VRRKLGRLPDHYRGELHSIRYRLSGMDADWELMVGRASSSGTCAAVLAGDRVPGLPRDAEVIVHVITPAEVVFYASD
jgi:hypothetical protein